MSVSTPITDLKFITTGSDNWLIDRSYACNSYTQVDIINFWNWKREYINETILDGFWWEINIKCLDKEIHSRGHNKYPTGSYSKLTAAIEKLLGD